MGKIVIKYKHPPYQYLYKGRILGNTEFYPWGNLLTLALRFDTVEQAKQLIRTAPAVTPILVKDCEFIELDDNDNVIIRPFLKKRTKK